ncbi:DUF3103 domain-containing protein [Vibrio crassostreae]|uniref:DUF3103 domain-containing protein n=1 Tax=Vibrio crassostreae TaxID=246167 RepID=UPI000F482614|nr:DUF3103 domain-containing protein [Vibrio crassostreae]ROO77436.1 hypothetical protein EDB53_1271 [Vibrio crassostreae]ROP25601.1 hypothetical protein EDB33_101686 [Vibrio crassostreae]ROP26381.1 hypothetical protein EDB34_101686 [Vibrio crassostreae]ROR69874.1 hypothetical protein EDB59_0520 [Vibrio crassostreae]ROR74991.1 hypothetical protein EDB54_0497 [Vibrio crassostreae]
MRPSFSISMVLATTVVGFQSYANNIDTTNALSLSENSSAQKQSLALQISTRYSDLELSLKDQITEKQLSTPIDKLSSDKPYSAFSSKMQKADLGYRTMKGINDFSDSVLEIRMADEAMIEAWKNGESPLFAFEPSGDDSNWQYIEAYDVYGQVHELDVYQTPDVPVFVIDSNGAEELKAGLMAMQTEMNKLGTETQINANSDKISAHKSQKQPLMNKVRRSISESEPEELNTTQLSKIRLAIDREPWISGKAEIYAIVTGVNASRIEPQIDLVEMPYLDYDKQTYYPNQTVIFWPRYRWGAADMILMEHDDGTDYKALAKLLVEAAEEILKMIPDPEVQGYAIIPQITGKIIDVIPEGVLVNDDDFVDVYYTLMQNTPYVDRPGAGGNAVASFTPVTISPTE